MKTVGVELEGGHHDIKITSPGYETFYGEINVTASGVVCVDHPGWANCVGDPPPWIDIRNLWEVWNFMKPGTAGPSYDDWVDGHGGAAGLLKNLSAIGEIIDGYLASAGEPGYLGFDVTFGDIGATIDYYLGA